MLVKEWLEEMIENKVKRYTKLGEISREFAKQGYKINYLIAQGLTTGIMKEVQKGKYLITETEIKEIAKQETTKEFNKIEKEVNERVGKIKEIDSRANEMVIKGEKSNIRVLKIEAGGYNIQTYHIRIKITEF